MYQNLYDCHIHSECSHDAKPPVMEICAQAEKLGFRGLAITDHAECNGIEGQDYIANINRSVADTRAAREAFAGRLDVLVGLEIAQLLQGPELADTIADGHSYDFVIGSLHGIGLAVSDFRYWVEVDASDLDSKVEDYYNQIMALIKWGKFDVLGHLTYPIRYVQGRLGVSLDFSRYSDLLDMVMRALIETGHGIEINTSGYRQGLGFPMPHLPWLKRYRELGGEIVTIGSDAHYTEHVGANVADSMDLMKEAGFRHVAIFRERKPQFLTLE